MLAGMVMLGLAMLIVLVIVGIITGCIALIDKAPLWINIIVWATLFLSVSYVIGLTLN